MEQFSLFEKEEQTYQKVYLDEMHFIERYNKVQAFTLDSKNFDLIWNQHPEEFHEVLMHGKLVKTPRWQQAYGKNYEYTGSRNNALPILDNHQKYLEWAQMHIDSRLNGLLINWYDGVAKHYIGKHRDSTKGLQKESPIVTISQGEERIFRFRPWRESGFQDFKVANGDVLVIPWDTNKRYTHEVPHFAKYKQRRISVTLRAYL
ncbi:MAG: alpha-ketoglutarate-dependent dioxygenase AlkB [Bacteroidota bacterium]